MPYLQMTCPHCMTEKAGFAGQNMFPLPLRSNGSQPDGGFIAMVCGVCRLPVIVGMEGIKFSIWFDGRGSAPDILVVWPEIKKPEAPQNCPDNVRRPYMQAMSSFRRKEFEAAGTMFRKSIDMATKYLNPGKGGNLAGRINALPDEIGITPAMREWAHQIRILGNDAAHEEEEITPEETNSLQAFTELFLTYAFSLPAMLQQRKQANPPR